MGHSLSTKRHLGTLKDVPSTTPLLLSFLNHRVNTVTSEARIQSRRSCMAGGDSIVDGEETDALIGTPSVAKCPAISRLAGLGLLLSGALNPTPECSQTQLAADHQASQKPTSRQGELPLVFVLSFLFDASRPVLNLAVTCCPPRRYAESEGCTMYSMFSVEKEEEEASCHLR